MLLKKVEIYGFKTFAERTVFEIGPGITCVVGPNGCGKSNLVDAVRWVLGETSSKTLRCRGMTEVIFNGSSGRKPLGYAEVSLYFDNTGRHFPIDYDELRISRRLYRTGESEYLINMDPCRRRDIKDLFANTGLGRSAYSVIGQGQIAAILQSSPKERRVLFEEAAGIAKYKQKRLEATRKLERVAHDLDKVRTVATEVEKGLKKAAVQAAKARRYKRLSEELRGLKIERALVQFAALRAELEEVRSGLEEAQKVYDAAESRAKRARSAVEETEAAETEIDRRLSEHGSRARELEIESNKLESLIERAQGNARDARERAQGARRKADGLAEGVALLRREHALTAEGLEEKRAELASLEEKSARAEETRNALEKERDSLRALQEEKRELSFRAASGLAQAEGEESGLEKELSSMSEKKKKMGRRLIQLAEELAQARRRASDARIALEELLASSAETQRQASTVQGRLVSVRDELARLEEKDRKLRGSEARLRARLDFLRELERKGEGIPEAARELSRAPGAVGVLADLVGVCLGYEKAAEAALGEMVTAVVVEEGEYDLLRRATASGATILRARPLGEAQKTPPRVLEHEGIIARAIDIFWCDPRMSRLFERLFGGVYISRGLHYAWRAAVSEPEAVIVTTEGEIVVGWGKVRTRSEHRGGVISRRNEMASLEGELARIRESIDANEGEKSHRKDEASRLGAQLEALNLSAGRMNEKAAHERAELASAQKEEERLAEEKGIQEITLQQTGLEESEMRERLGDLRGKAEEARLVEEEAKTASRALAEDIREVEKEFARVNSELQDVRVREAGLRQELRASEKELASTARGIEEKEVLVRSFLLDEERETERKLNSESKAAEAEEELSRLRGQLERVSSVKDELQREKDLARGRIGEMRAMEKAEKAGSEGARKTLDGFRLKRTVLSTKLSGLLESGARELECRLEEELSSRGGIEPKESLEEDIRAVERKLRNLGSVNHEALAEQEELSKKLEFLQTQLDDLRQARYRLADLISQLNRKSRALFRETFDRVKEEYEQMFRKLFGGGKGELRLEECEDLLEAGVEMIAKPPGKNPKTLMALSGGEQGLTAIALLFAIFKSRPSPFCVLDEADAPLDEENDRRFIRGIAEFSKETQFIIVTHKKVTMAHADAIYGMTMQEPGVTKKLSVSFQQIEKGLSAA